MAMLFFRSVTRFIELHLLPCLQSSSDFISSVGEKGQLTRGGKADICCSLCV